ncbi:adenine phosphoribosyltransferase [Pedobacter flavus]|uniref:Adenine phosphoribosyltransferase n=1 Tax=Pedobacter flavus TaxID=3113906 RepID=A0ABU7H1C3_9SPHI|nr:adenine phosphoribosyltransferase [Pedobacter sp. VNH31]MEE1885131.1 adenine phosphoribosyltransferase [Pedobacter sp. VNH31]
MIEERIKQTIRDIYDFPKPGIIFKDISTIFLDAALCKSIVKSFVDKIRHLEPDAIVGLESRGFLLGPSIAMELGIPFVLIRKEGKLPGKCIHETYDLEYGTATIEIQENALASGKKVIIHDDLLATGGTVLAASNLLHKLNIEVVGYAFIIELSALLGRAKLEENKTPVISLASYT